MPEIAVEGNQFFVLELHSFAFKYLIQIKNAIYQNESNRQAAFFCEKSSHQHQHALVDFCLTAHSPDGST